LKLLGCEYYLRLAALPVRTARARAWLERAVPVAGGGRVWRVGPAARSCRWAAERRLMPDQRRSRIPIGCKEDVDSCSDENLRLGRG